MTKQHSPLILQKVLYCSSELIAVGQVAFIEYLQIVFILQNIFFRCNLSKTTSLHCSRVSRLIAQNGNEKTYEDFSFVSKKKNPTPISPGFPLIVIS